MEVRLFATLAEVAGDDSISVDPEPGATLGDVLEVLFEQAPALESHVFDDAEDTVATHVRVLHEGTDPFLEGDGLDEPVAEGDELALFPPVSGG